MEIWRPIPEWPGFEASSEGRIRRNFHRILTPDKSSVPRRGYLRVSLKARRALKKQGRFMVHVLVARAFIGECPPGYEHNHKDGDKLNNRPDNLEFVTPSQNKRHAIDVLKHSTGRLGMEHSQAKLTDTQVIAIRRRRAQGEALKVLAADFGVNMSVISAIARGKTWKHLPI